MERAIRIVAGDVVARGVLNDGRTATAIWEALPLEMKAQTWGDEVYGDIGITAAAEQPRATVAMGDLGYWPPGRALCIFFGPTPASRGDEIRPASPVDVVGRVEDAPAFRRVRDGARVRIERA
ncbi:MAG TPA: cyclophilin-like fold protein [Candidatus Tectomicrobia bacterium]|nr:cyclophilin-like fold protein [Candidatus Tectomicrobia bacterium]